MKKFFKPVIALLLCAVMVLGILPTAFAAQTDGKRLYTRSAELSQLEEQFLSDSEARAAEYPNGAMMIVEASAEMDMNKTYAIDIFRQGGTKGEAKIKLSTIDLTAGYNEAYRLYLSDDLDEQCVKGEKKLYYYDTGIPYVARLGEQKTQYMTRDNVDDLDKAKQDASEINDMSAESIPHSTETVLTFAEGESRPLIPTVTPASAADYAEFGYSTENSDIISVNADGEVTALKEGKAVVTVSCGNAVTEVTVNVTPAVNYIIGDVNCDGNVDILDATMIQKYAVEKVTLNDYQLYVGDVNNDGLVDVLDATMIQKFAVEKITEFTKKHYA